MDIIAVDGERVHPGSARRTILLHNPRGVLSAARDAKGRPTVTAAVGAVGVGLYPVGRLDMNSTGLLLLTNDGELAHALLQPRRAVPRVYQVKVNGTPDAEAIRRLHAGEALTDLYVF